MHDQQATVKTENLLTIEGDEFEAGPDSLAYLALQIVRCGVLGALITVAAWIVIRYFADWLFVPLLS